MDSSYKYIMLFGPPGIGKSTIVKNLHGFDLESVPVYTATGVNISLLHQTISAALIRKVKLFAAGGVLPCHLPEPRDCYTVLLHLPQTDYESRRYHRDSLMPHKSLQSPHKISDWFALYNWDNHLLADNNVVPILSEFLALLNQ